eukprot:3736245-Amphidinium_carterae.2
MVEFIDTVTFDSSSHACEIAAFFRFVLGSALCTGRTLSCSPCGIPHIFAEFILPTCYPRYLQACGTTTKTMLAVAQGAKVKLRKDASLALKFVTINVRTLFDSGKMKFVGSQLHSIHADLVMMQETRLPAHVSDEDHSLFAQHLQQALSNLLPDEVCIVGCDLNARTASLDEYYSCIGPLACSTCPQLTSFRKECLQLLSVHNLVAINTFLENASIPTWRHPCGTEQQIDYVFVPHQYLQAGRVLAAAVGPWAFFDSVTTSDHRHVEVTLMITSHAKCAGKKQQHRRIRFVNDSHISDFSKALPAAIEHWNGSGSAAFYIQNSVQLAFEQITVLHKPCSNDLNGRTLVTNCAYNLTTRYDTAIMEKISVLRKEVRSALRSERREWFDSACQDIRKHEASRCPCLLHRAVRALTKADNHRGSRLYMELTEQSSMIARKLRTCSLITGPPISKL